VVSETLPSVKGYNDNRLGYTPTSMRAWEDHGGITVSLYPPSLRRHELILDNLVVQWGVQDNYEIVRKVGRGKYSEVCCSSSQAMVMRLLALATRRR